MKHKKIVMTLAFYAVFMGIFGPLCFSAGASAREEFVVNKGETKEFGGGNYVEVEFDGGKAGIVYGTGQLPNHITIYSEGERCVGEVDTFDGSRLLKKEIISLKTLVTQEIEEIIEFRDINNNSRFDSLIEEDGTYNLSRLDYPIRGLKITNFIAGVPEIVKVNGREISLGFTLFMLRPKENLRWNDIKGKMMDVSGKKIADKIEIDFQMNITRKKEGLELPRYHSTEGSPQRDGSIIMEGEVFTVSLHYSYSIENWNFRYPDSRLFVKMKRGMFMEERSGEFVERGIYANITTSSPRYMELNGFEALEKKRDIYGRSLSFFLDGEKIGKMVGDTVSVVDGENRSYIMVLSGQYRKNIAFGESGYEGFELVTTSAYWQGNISCGESMTASFTSVSPFEVVDATPPWSVVAPFEVAFVAIYAVYLSYRRRD